MDHDDQALPPSSRVNFNEEFPDNTAWAPVRPAATVSQWRDHPPPNTYADATTQTVVPHHHEFRPHEYQDVSFQQHLLPPPPPLQADVSVLPPSSDEGYSDDDYDRTNFYSFRSSRDASKPGSIWSTSERTVEIGDTELEDEGGLSLPGPGLRPIPSHVFQSQYVGDSCYGGYHSVKLTTTESATPDNQPHFRWFHFETTFMDFDVFSAKVSSIDKLSNVEMDGIKKMLSMIRRDALRGFQAPDGKEGSKMTPSCYRQSLPTDLRYKGLPSRAISWVCLPHFSLERYSGLYADTASPTDTRHRIPTLLQSIQPHASKRRDLEQVIS